MNNDRQYTILFYYIKLEDLKSSKDIIIKWKMAPNIKISTCYEHFVGDMFR